MTLTKVALSFFIFLELLIFSPIGFLDNYGFSKILEFKGPFSVTSYKGVYVAEIQELRGVTSLTSLLGDGSDDPYSSRADLRINGLLGEAHVQHSEIGDVPKLGSFRYSHWGNALYFSLPNGLLNNEDTHLVATLPIRTNPKIVKFIYALIFFQAIGICYIQYKIKKRSEAIKQDRNINISFDYLPTILAILFICIFSILVAQLIAVMPLQIYTFSQSAFAARVAKVMELAPALGIILLYFILLIKLASFRIFGVRLYLRNKQPIYEVFIVVTLYLLSDYFFLWNGVVRSSDLSSSSVMGLVPFNDANGHFFQPFLVYFNGLWDGTGARRPLAAALRVGISGVVGFSPYANLFIQSILLGASITFMHERLRNLIGSTSCWIITSCILIISRPYLQTFLTESLAIPIFVMSGTLVIKSILQDRVRDLLWGIFFSILAEMIRPGNFLLIPIIFLWAFYRIFSKNKKLLYLPIVVMAGVLLMSTVLQKTFNPPYGGFGSNFGEILCGSVHDKSWTFCSNAYKTVLTEGDESLRNAQLIQISGKEFLSHPELFSERIKRATLEIIQRVPILLVGAEIIPYYENYKNINVSIVKIAFIVGLVSLIFNQRYALLLLLLGSIFTLAISGGLLYFDDGTRTMVGTWIYCAFLLGLSASILDKNNLSSNILSIEKKINLELIFSAIYLAIILSAYGVKIGGLSPKIGLGLESFNHDAGNVAIQESYIFGFLITDNHLNSNKFIFQITGKNYIRMIEKSGIAEYENLTKYKGEPLLFYVTINRSGSHTTQIRSCSDHPVLCGLQ